MNRRLLVLWVILLFLPNQIVKGQSTNDSLQPLFKIGPRASLSVLFSHDVGLDDEDLEELTGFFGASMELKPARFIGFRMGIETYSTNFYRGSKYINNGSVPSDIYDIYSKIKYVEGTLDAYYYFNTHRRLRFYAGPGISYSQSVSEDVVLTGRSEGIHRYSTEFPEYFIVFGKSTLGSTFVINRHLQVFFELVGKFKFTDWAMQEGYKYSLGGYQHDAQIGLVTGVFFTL